jgi:hypothetical protein
MRDADGFSSRFGVEKGALLAEIFALRGLPNLHRRQKEDLQVLEKSYNEIVTKMDDAKRSPLTDPLEALPTEIWQDIIRRCQNPAYWKDWKPRFVDLLLDLTNVSKNWQEAILSTPIFWTEVSIDIDMEDMAAKVVACITLSGDLPLDLILGFPIPLELGEIGEEEQSGEKVEIFQSLRKNSHRIRSLTFSRVHGDYVSFRNRIEDDILPLGALVALENVTCHVSEFQPNLDAVLEEAGNLRLLHRIDITLNTLTSDSAQTLQSIQTSRPYRTLLPYLYHLPFLDSVTFEPSSQLDDACEEEQISPVSSQEPLSWRRLSILQVDSENVSSILRRASSSLVELSVTISWEILSHFLVACSQMDRLRILTMVISQDTKIKFRPPFTGVCSSITDLTIYIGGFTEYDEDNEPEPISAHDNLELLFDMMPSFVHNLRELNIMTLLQDTPKLTFTQELPYLTRIWLLCRARASFELDDICLPNAERIEFLYTDTFSSSISAPNAVNLIISLENELLELNRWSSIRSLDIRTDDAVWSEVSLPNLETLALHSIGSAIYNTESSAFFHEVALNPTNIPKLRHIELEIFPEWDLLFVMLERRNFLMGGRISPIKSLTFPSMPHSVILRPLSDRLRGHFSERPSNRSLSLQGIAPIFLDKTM